LYLDDESNDSPMNTYYREISKMGLQNTDEVDVYRVEEGTQMGTTATFRNPSTWTHDVKHAERLQEAGDFHSWTIVKTTLAKQDVRCVFDASIEQDPMCGTIYSRVVLAPGTYEIMFLAREAGALVGGIASTVTAHILDREV
jgi:hypothetical protein